MTTLVHDNYCSLAIIAFAGHVCFGAPNQPCHALPRFQVDRDSCRLAPEPVT